MFELNSKKNSSFESNGELAEALAAAETSAKPGDGESGGRESPAAAPARIERRRSAAVLLLGKLLIISTLVSFIFVGLMLNVLQLILTISIRFSGNKTWRRWHKRLMGQIVYAIISPLVFLFYVWPRWELSIVVDDMSVIDEVQKNVFWIVIANHTYELDWMTCCMLADQLGNMGNYKCFSKDELKWLPIVGWTFWMADLIYVKRDWNEDRPRIESKLNELLDYDQVLLGIFAEGTRWTPEKYNDATRFANERSIEPYKHHLFPRPRGFNYTLRHYLRAASSGANAAAALAEPVRLFNLEIAMPDRPKFTTFLEGGLIRAAVYWEEVPLSDEIRAEALESKDENDCPKMTQLLLDIFRRKDQLIDEFTQNNMRFPLRSTRAGHFPVRRPTRSFTYWLASMSLTYGTFAYLANSVFADSATFWSLFAGFIISGILLLRRIERETVPTKLRNRATTTTDERRPILVSAKSADGSTASDGQQKFLAPEVAAPPPINSANGRQREHSSSLNDQQQRDD
jgi:lysophosphatidic acid acyltransferase/lysophosphatidylinositol acyltransferase